MHSSKRYSVPRHASFVALTLIGTLTFGAACGSSTNNKATHTESRTNSVGRSTTGPAAALVPSTYKNRTIRVVVINDYPPDEYVVGGKLVGTNPDLAKAIGDDLGLRFDIQGVTFDIIIPGLQAGRYDIAMPSFQVTPARRKILDFVTYFAAGTGFMILANSAHNINSAAGLCGLTAASLAGSEQAAQTQQFSRQCTQNGKHPISLQTYQSNNQSALAVASGRAQVDISTSDTLAYASSQASGRFKVAPFTYAKAPAGIGLPKGSKLGPAVLQALKDLMANGTYDKIYKKYNVASTEISNPTLITK